MGRDREVDGKCRKFKIVNLENRKKKLVREYKNFEE